MAPLSATADLVLLGGRIWHGGTRPGKAGGSQTSAVAIRDGAVVAVGSDDELGEFISPATEVIRLSGRRVLPGLIDSHIHAARAGLTWERELHWEDITSLQEGLDLIRRQVAEAPPGTWICVVGGWHARQLAEGRPPRRSELDAVAPEHLVYVQMLYDEAVLNSKALQACGWDRTSANPPGGTLERDPRSGDLTGVIRGFAAFRIPMAAALQADREQQRLGTLAMLRRFATHGLTGVVDGGGLLMTPESYQPLYDLWSAGELPMRVRLFVSASGAGSEVADARAWSRHLPAGFGDDWLRICGLGEVVHLGCHDFEGLNPFEVTDSAWAEFLEISRLAVQRNWPVSVHAVLDSTLSRVLDAWEIVAKECGGLRERRFSVVHADQASPQNLDRLARLGVAVLIQSRLLLKAADYEKAWGEQATRHAPPIGEMVQRDIPIAAGSDATRANWFSPWPCIWWLVTGAALGDGPSRDERHLMSVEQALVAYTRNAAWLTGEEHRRGQIRPGFLADLCVTTEDPFECDPAILPTIRSDLTVVGGRIVHRSSTV